MVILSCRRKTRQVGSSSGLTFVKMGASTSTLPMGPAAALLVDVDAPTPRTVAVDGAAPFSVSSSTSSIGALSVAQW